MYEYVLLISWLICTIQITRSQDPIIYANLLGSVDTLLERLETDLYIIENEIDAQVTETVAISVYYECLCPDCIKFDRDQFRKVVEQLAPYLNIHTYPYGNAETFEKNGKVEIICQHGPKECYGNKLHACSLNYIADHTEALLFNFCMMDPQSGSRGSDDPTATKCGSEMGISVEPILRCAKSEQGTQLLKYYGEESKKANFLYVPYILINGVEWTGDDFMKDVCTAFIHQPKACRQQ